MSPPVEIELKFICPPSARAAVAAELARVGDAVRRQTLRARYFDTDRRHLARAGLVWRVRREGRLWVQTLKTHAVNGLERFEHAVPCPDGLPDPQRHAGTPAGDRLVEVLRDARAEGEAPQLRFSTEIRRTARRIRAPGAVVEVVLDEGRLVGEAGAARICEVEFELVSGSVAAMLALVQRWRRRHHLRLDPHGKSERGECLADARAYPPVRKSQRPACGRHPDAARLHAAVLDECLAQILRNAVGVSDGADEQRADHVHQLRVGIRRLRSALRCFRGWAPQPPQALVQGLRELFSTLGRTRDDDVLGTGILGELRRIGAPELTLPRGPAVPDAAAAVAADACQDLLLAWLAWRHAQDAAPGAALSTRASAPAAGRARPPVPHPPEAAAAEPRPPLRAAALRRAAARRLARWHDRIAADAIRFAELDETAVHDLRKRIKRQRYALEFLADVLPGGAVRRYLEPLAAAQERMGALNDLFVARDRYQAATERDPSAWFALGWLAARVAELRSQAAQDLAVLARCETPGR